MPLSNYVSKLHKTNKTNNIIVNININNLIFENNRK